MPNQRYTITDEDFDLEIEPAELTVPVKDLEASTDDRPVYLNLTYYVWLEDDKTVQFEYDHATRTGRDIDYRDLEMIEIVTELLGDVGVPTQIPTRMTREDLRERRGLPPHVDLPDQAGGSNGEPGAPTEPETGAGNGNGNGPTEPGTGAGADEPLPEETGGTDEPLPEETGGTDEPLPEETGGTDEPLPEETDETDETEPAP